MIYTTYPRCIEQNARIFFCDGGRCVTYMRTIRHIHLRYSNPRLLRLTPRARSVAGDDDIVIFINSLFYFYKRFLS